MKPEEDTIVTLRSLSETGLALMEGHELTETQRHTAASCLGVFVCLVTRNPTLAWAIWQDAFDEAALLEAARKTP